MDRAISDWGPLLPEFDSYFAAGDSVVARVLRRTKVLMVEVPNAPQPLPQRQPHIVPLDIVKPAGSAVQRSPRW
jgi:hypothetical protein